MKKGSKTIWTVVSSLFVALTVIAEITFFAFICVLKLLPIKFLIAIAVAMIMVTIVIAVLAFLQFKKHPKVHVQQIIAYILCLPVIVGCIIGSLAVNKLDETVEAVTTPPEISTIMGVYVLKEDAASKIEDTQGYTFAINDSYDKKNNDAMVAQLEKKFNHKIKTKHYATMLKSIDGLYNNEADALIISESNVVVLEDLRGYETFLDKAKLIYTMNIYVEVPQEDVKPEDKKPSKNPIKNLFDEIIDVIKPDKQDKPSAQNDDKNETTAPNLETENQVKPPVDNDTSTKPDKEENIGKAEDPFIMFISGSDSRNGIMDRTLSDVNILAVVNPKTKQILLVNTPRDIFLPNPAFGGQKDKLTHCGLSGIHNSISALSAFYKIPINYYVQFNFTGFETLIDLLGGVTVYSPKTFKTTHGQYPIHVGNNHLNGKVALSFVRERFAFLGGDDTRGWNQMQVIKNLISQVSASTLIYNYSEILDTVEGMFITNMDRKKISQLAEMQIKDMSRWEIFSFAITGTLGTDKPAALGGDEATVVYPHSYTVNKAKLLMNKVLNDKVIKKADLY